MSEGKTYRVIISDRTKRMLGMHIRFLAQVSKELKNITAGKSTGFSCRKLCLRLQRETILFLADGISEKLAKAFFRMLFSSAARR